MIPLFALGAFCLRWTNTDVFWLVAANDGAAFVSVESTTSINNEEAMLRVSNDLQKIETLDVPHSSHIACSKQGDWLITRSLGLLNIQDNVLKRLRHESANEVVFTANDTMIAYVPYDSESGPTICLMRRLDGEQITSVPFNGRDIRLKGSGELLAAINYAGQLNIYAVDEQGLHQTASLPRVTCFDVAQDEVIFVDRNQWLHKVDRTGNIRMLYKLPNAYQDIMWIDDKRFVGIDQGEIFIVDTVSSKRTFVVLTAYDKWKWYGYRHRYALADDRLIVGHENKISHYDLAGNLIDQRALRAGFSGKQMRWLLAVFALGMSAWMTWFLASGRHLDPWLTPWINAFVFFGILQLIWCTNPYLAEHRTTYGRGYQMLPIGTWWLLPLLAYVGFYLAIRRPALAGIAFVGGVLATLTLPLAVATGLLRGCGFRLHHVADPAAESQNSNSNKSWLPRLTIGHLLAITLLVAWSFTISADRDKIDSIEIGLFAVPAVALAVVVNYSQILAYLLFSVSVFLASGLAIGLAILPRHVFFEWSLFMILFSSGFLVANFRCSGYTIQLRPR